MSTKEFARDLERLRTLRDRQAATFAAVNSAHAGVKRKSRASGDEVPELDEEAAEALRSGYKDAFTVGAEEFQVAGDALRRLLGFLRVKCQRDVKRREEAAAATREVKVDRGNIWAHNDVVLPIGQLVAANTDSQSEVKLWFLCTVAKYDPARERYRVVDADGSTGFKKAYNLDAIRIVPLYALEKYPLAERRTFGPGSRVMALFPDTTTFYPCDVIRAPRGAQDTYTLRFDDDDDLDREVNALYVFPFPPGYKE